MTTTPELALQLDPTQQKVRERYAEAAIAASSAASKPASSPSVAGSGCCDEGCCSEASATTGMALYDAASREGLPDAALLASLGCGNPVAVAEPREGET